MAGNVDDVAMVVLSGTVSGEDFENVFFYRVADVPTAGYLTGLLSEFDTVVMAPYADVAHGGVSFVQLYAKNIYTGDEAFLAPLAIPSGLNPTIVPNPTFIAASVKLVRQNARVRHGRKSIVGSGEDNMVVGVWEAAYQATLETLAATFATTLNPGAVDAFEPIILGRVKEAVPGTVPQQYEYRLPADQVEMADNWSPFTQVIVSPLVTTMNSRKVNS